MSERLHSSKPLLWTRSGDRLVCRVNIAAHWEGLAQAYVLHRLRQVRALPFGFVHPTDVHLDESQIVIRLPIAAVDKRPMRTISSDHWRTRRLLPLLDILLLCQGQGVRGLYDAGIVEGRWVPPPEWFLPNATDAQGTLDARDARALLEWIDAEQKMGQTDSHVASVLEALRRQDAAFLRKWLQETRRVASYQTPRGMAPLSFLNVLAEGEFLERVATAYRYNQLSPKDVDALGMDPRRHWVLEIDQHFRDRHFPTLTRPSPQEFWDSLIDQARVTPVLVLSSTLPNPLSTKMAEADEALAQWIGVHDGQPYVYLKPEGQRIPREGFFRLFSTGDDVLMERKRAFSSFAGTHPALTPLLDAAPDPRPFQDNPQTRDELEEAILGTQGIFAVQGPPGTGKTHLATEVVKRFLARHEGGRVLVCAKEHFALDHILEKITAALRKSGLAFRAWRSLSLAKKRRTIDEINEEWLAASVTRNLGERRFAAWAEEWAHWQAASSDQHDQRLATLGRESANVFFATTMDASLAEFLGTESFDLVIVEEAGKCYPSELLHALCLGRTSLMIGDQRQLPPYQEARTRAGIAAWKDAIERALHDDRYRQEMERRFGQLFDEMYATLKQPGALTKSEESWLRPFEFLFDRLPTRHRLEEQYRMEAPLSRLVGTVFYGRPFIHRKYDLVRRGLLPDQPLGDVVPSKFDVPLLWFDVPHMSVEPMAGEDPEKRGVRDNEYEVQVLLAYLRNLKEGRSIDFVILTPYDAQKRRLLANVELRHHCERLTRVSFEQVVRTVDEYQGREADLTVISLVRNNGLGMRAWGFMTEPERLNVMFSRSRFRQVVIGSGAHIDRHAAECLDLKRCWDAYKQEAREPRHARIIPTSELLHG